MSGSPQPLLSKGAKRRANSCKPCRDSKSKCSGGIPCTTCQKKRQKPRCYYLGPFSRDSENDDPAQAISAELSSTEPLNPGAEQETFFVNEEDIVELSDLVGRPHDDFYGTLSLARSVDEFKELLPMEGSFQDIVNSIQPTQIFDLATWRGYNPSTSQPVAPEQVRPNLGFQLSIPLERLYAKYYAIRDQLAVGQATQAWSAFGSLFRDAELFGLKVFANSAMTEDEMEDPQACRHLWWLLVELDTQLSFLLGRRPSIDPSHNVPKPALPEIHSEGSDGTQEVLDFTEYMTEFLNHVHQDQNDRHSHWEDRATMLQSELNRLRAIQSNLPHLPLSTLPDTAASSRAQHQVDVHLVLTVLYCQMLRSTSSETTRTGRLRNPRKSAVKTHYRELLKSLRATIDIFDYSYKLDHASTASSWPRCFGVFCAASMLGIARLRQDVDVDTDSERIQRALDTLVDLANAGQVPAVAQLAVETLPEILDGIRALEQQPGGNAGAVPMARDNMTAKENASTSSVPRASKSAPKIKPEAPSLKRRNTSNLEEDIRVGKRLRPDTEPKGYENPLRTPTWQDVPYSRTMTLEDTTTAPKQEPTASQSFAEQPFLPSATTSFNDQMEFYEAGYVPTHPDNFDEYHPDSHWLHPPMLYHPPLYDVWQQAQFQLQENLAADANPQQGFYDSQLGLSMDEAHQIETAMQHQSFLQRQQLSPTHAQGMMMSASGIHSTDTTRILGHPPSDSQQTQIYGSRMRPHRNPEQVMSSPGEGAPQMEGIPEAARDRRRSLVDIREQQMGTWGMEMSANYHGHTVRGALHSGPQHRRRSPPQSVIPSPTDEYGPQADATTMQQLQAQQSRSVPPTRRQSTAHMESTAMHQPGQLADQIVHQQLQARQQQQHIPYDLAAHIPYNVTMTNEGVLEYNQHLQYHQEQHHIPTTVTTGPYTGEGHHWGWTG